MPFQIINNRYPIIKKLGEGGMGAVYLAEDQLYTGRHVALKTIRPEVARSNIIDQFQREFEVMTRLHHPNLAQVYDFGVNSDDQTYFLTMEYVDGTDLHTHRANKNADETPLPGLFVTLLRAIEFIHSRGILHRDIKPHNIMLTGDGRLKILDFGLSDLRADEAARTKGTLLYFAPEVLTGSVDHRTDLFALGMTFFELMTGVSFYGTAGGESTKKLTSTTQIVSILHDASSFAQNKRSALTAIFDERWRAIIDRMTAYDAADRYPSCTDVIGDINACKKVFQVEYDLETVDTRNAYVLGAGFVGREAELNRLIDWLNHPDGEKQGLRIHGEAGIGKSRLFAEFKKFCQLQNIPFFQGDCVELGQPNFGAFLPILNGLLLQATDRQIETYGGELKKILPDHLRLTDIKPNPKQDPKTERGLLIQVITRFLVDYATVLDRKWVIFLNDMHWADETSVEVLAELMYKLSDTSDRENQKGLGLRIYVSSRDEGLEKLDPIKSKGRLTDAQLYPFDEHNVQSYIEAVFGKQKVGDSLRRAIPDINRKVGGNPFFLQELVKSLVHAGLIERQTQHWVLTAPIAKADIPTNLKGLIVARIARLNLSEANRRVVHILALLRYSPTYDELNRIVPVTHGLLNQLVEQEILKTEIMDGQPIYRTAHDLIRNILLDQTPQVAELHHFIAEQLKAIHADHLDDYVAELAWHYAEAGDREKALPYLEKAGDRARENYRNQDALDFYNRLLDWLDDDHMDKQIDTMVKKVEILDLLGKWEDAVDVLIMGIDRCPDSNPKKFSLKNQLASAYRKKGDYENALPLLQSILDHLQDKPDEQSKKMYATAASHRGMIYWRQNDYSRAMEDLETSLAIYDELGNKIGYALTMGNMGLVHWTQGDFHQAKACFQLNADICNDLGHKRAYSKAMTNLGHYFNRIREYDTALNYFKVGKNVSESLGDKEEYGRAIGNMGMVYNNLGDYERALEHFETGKRVYEELGDKRGYSMAVAHIGGVYKSLGNYQKALEYYEVDKKIHESSGDTLQYCIAVGLMGDVFLKKGDVAKALTYFDDCIPALKDIGAKSYLCERLLSKATALYRLGNYEMARNANREAHHIATELNLGDVLFESAVLDAKLRAVSDPAAGLQTLSDMLVTAKNEEEQAELHYEIYRINRTLQPQRLDSDIHEHSQTALQLYQALYEKTPRSDYKVRIDELSAIQATRISSAKADSDLIDINDIDDSIII